MTETINPEDIVWEEYNNEAAFFQKVDRLITGKSINVKPVIRTGHFAYSDTRNIFIDFNAINENSYDDNIFLTTSKALNYHELAHILFTKVRIDNLNTKKIVSPRFKELYEKRGYSYSTEIIKRYINLLEEGRIENLMSIKFPSLKKYFLWAILRLILKDQNKIENNKIFYVQMFVLLYSRLFFSRAVIKKIEKKCESFYSKSDIKKIKLICDCYNLTTDPNKQIELALDLWEILIEDGKFLVKEMFGGSASKKTTREEKEAIKAIAEALKNGGNNKNNKSINIGKGNEWEDIKNIVSSVSSPIKEENEKDIRAIYGGMSAGVSDVDVKTKSEPFNPSNNDRICAMKMRNLLRKIRNGLQARYDRPLKSGRLDMRSAMLSRGQTKVFKKFKNSQLGRSRMAVALLLDSSGSMNTPEFNTALKTAWALDYALTGCNDKTMVIEYSDSFKVLKGFYGRKADWCRHYHRGTQPREALEYSYVSLLKMKRIENISTLICFILTDGSWSYEHECDSIIRKMNKSGINTVLIYPQELKKEIKIEKHNTQNQLIIPTIEAMEPAMRSYIRKIQMKLLKEAF